jgi:hypothetical protein
MRWDECQARPAEKIAPYLLKVCPSNILRLKIIKIKIKGMLKNFSR